MKRCVAELCALRLYQTSLTAVCSCHVTYVFQSESTLYSCLNVKELLLAKWLSVRLRTKWFWVRAQLHSLTASFNYLVKHIGIMQGFHNLFDSYSANTWKLNVTILKINVIIQKRTISISSEHAIHNTLFSFRVKKKMYMKRCGSNKPPKINRKCVKKS